MSRQRAPTNSTPTGVGGWFGPEVVVRAYDSPRGRYVSASKVSPSAEVTVFFGPFANHEQPTEQDLQSQVRSEGLILSPTGDSHG